MPKRPWHEPSTHIARHGLGFSSRLSLPYSWIRETNPTCFIHRPHIQGQGPGALWAGPCPAPNARPTKPETCWAFTSLRRLPSASSLVRGDHQSSRPPKAFGHGRRLSAFPPNAEQDLKEQEAPPLGADRWWYVRHPRQRTQCQPQARPGQPSSAWPVAAGPVGQAPELAAGGGGDCPSDFPPARLGSVHLHHQGC